MKSVGLDSFQPDEFEHVAVGEDILPSGFRAAGEWWIPEGGFYVQEGQEAGTEFASQRWLTYDPRARRKYYPSLSSRLSLLADFGKLAAPLAGTKTRPPAPPTIEQIIEFANSYGPLGINQPGFVVNARVRPGESLAAWHREIREFAKIQRLTNGGSRTARMDEELANAINVQLRAHTATMLLLKGKVFTVRMTPQSLLGAIYLKLAQSLAGAKHPMRPCLNPRCPNGGYFQPSRRGKTFCDGNCRNQAWRLEKSSPRKSSGESNE